MPPGNKGWIRRPVKICEANGCYREGNRRKEPILTRLTNLSCLEGGKPGGIGIAEGIAEGRG